ncbi:MAG: hypothetical protein ACKVX9_06715 [Blastocatellia bacterium]
MNRVETAILTLIVVGGFALGLQPIQSTHAAGIRHSISVDSPPGGGQAAADHVAREYRGIKLGMKREEVRSLMGAPESTAESSDDFKLKGEDTMTVHYDGDAVKAIQIAILDPKNAPAWKDIVGDAEINELANGAKTARKTLLEEKFWVSMYQSKDGLITRITISRI